MEYLFVLILLMKLSSKITNLCTLNYFFILIKYVLISLKS